MTELLPIVAAAILGGGLVYLYMARDVRMYRNWYAFLSDIVWTRLNANIHVDKRTGYIGVEFCEEEGTAEAPEGLPIWQGDPVAFKAALAEWKRRNRKVE